MKFISIVFLMLIFSVSVSADDEVNPYEEKLLWLETSNAELDFANAIEKNDYRIKCVMGYGLRCPGIKDRQGLEYTVIEGTGDVITSDKHDALLRMAAEYARTYNKYLVDAKDAKKSQ